MCGRVHTELQGNAQPVVAERRFTNNTRRRDRGDLMGHGLIARAGLFDLYQIIAVARVVAKGIIDSISFTVVAIAVFDVRRYLPEEEVQRHKELGSQTEVRQTLTRFMVAIAIALSLEGLVGIFEAAIKDPKNLLYPMAVVLAPVVVMLGLGVYQRLSITLERLVHPPD